MKRSRLGILGLALVLPLALTACVGGSDESSETSTGDAGSGTGEIQYWMWDANQLPVYQQCADAFTKANPDVTVKLSQFGWDDYWTKVTTGFVSGTAPDVFVDHQSKYPEFVKNSQLVALDENVTADNVATDVYQPGLAELWVAEDGKRYGMPKDWDTIALFYNKGYTDAAGLTKEQMDALEWNPTDGGTYEEAIAKLTVDANGLHGNEPGFDKNNVKTYGLALTESGGSNGQTQWSMYTGSNGWEFTNNETWGDQYNYNDPKFQETIGWWRSLIEKGYMPPLEKTVGASGNEQFGAGNYAMITEGSWNTNSLTGTQGVEVGIAPTPIGPSGQRASMFNGLGDSIWTGSKNQAAAWKWVKYLSSAECQDVVGASAPEFPPLTTATDAPQAAFNANGHPDSP